MKKFIAGIAFLIFVHSVHAQVYSITTNANWSAVHAGDCWTCTFNISSGVTLTLNTSNTCGTCTINGGTINMSSNFSFQSVTFSNTTINMNGHTMTPNSGSATFSNTIVNASGTSLLNAVIPVNIVNSTFNFSGTAEFRNNGGTLNVSASHIYFYGNSFFNATAGPVNLTSNTQLIAGDGTNSSKAYLLFNGPTLNLVDAGSAFFVKGINNYYANWGSYNSLSNSKSYATSGNGKNCGGAGQNACTSQFYYGCASFSNLGGVTCSVLAVSISDFKASQTGDQIKLSWSVSDNTLNSYFKVERSTDLNQFKPLTTMEVNGDGRYTFVDEAPAIGENNYRISLIGQDGKIGYSNIINVQNNVTAGPVVYPNPVSGGHLFVQMPSAETATMSVYSMEGQMLDMRSLSGQTKYIINLPQTRTRQLLMIRIVMKGKISSFNLLNFP